MPLHNQQAITASILSSFPMLKFGSSENAVRRRLALPENILCFHMNVFGMVLKNHHTK